MVSLSVSTLQERANFPLQDSLCYWQVIQDSFERVARSGQTILSEGVRGFEEDFAHWLGAGMTGEHCIGVGNGTDAIELALRCAGVGKGGGVIVPSLTAYATVAAILRMDATPIFADVEADRPVISLAEVERLLASKVEKNIQAVIAVHLYGEACDLRSLGGICNRYAVALIEDCAQATGTMYEGSAVGTWGDFAAFSFYPTKNLAALGDGGMLVVGPNADAEMLRTARRLRFYGWDHSKEAIQFGVNSRLDEVQAWILRGKLQDLDQRIERRRAIASKYIRTIETWAEIANIKLPHQESNWNHSYHLFAIGIDPMKREEVLTSGRHLGIPYGVHYSLACHQHSYIKSRYGDSIPQLPHSEYWASSTLSLPLNPYIDESDIIRVNDHLKEILLEQ